jgi:hypothetical protein
MKSFRARVVLSMFMLGGPALAGCEGEEQSDQSDDVETVSSALTVVTGEYHEGPDVNDRYIAPWTTETYAKVWRPAFSGTTKYPLILMQHGSHYPCRKNNSNPPVEDNDQYAATGTCPSGYTFIKDHEGYDYIANDLASRGYIVVSMSAHLGFPVDGGSPSDDPIRLRARGRLALWHLRRLSDWNRGVSPTPSGLGASFQNRIDFSQVGLMGHSRGGPAMRSALADYRTSPPGGWAAEIPGMTIRSLVEIASADVPPQTLAIDDPINIPWLGLVGLCDGDVNPIAVGAPFDRMLGDWNDPTFKSLYGITGANHNAFNSHWLHMDNGAGCKNQTAISASTQRSSGLTAVGQFFRATVGTAKDATLAKIFDPVNAAPSGPTIARAYTAAPDAGLSARLEDFTAPDGINSNWTSNSWSGLTTYTHQSGRLERDNNYSLAFVEWSGGASSNKFLQSNFAPPGTGWDLHTEKYLELRVDTTAGSAFSSALDFTIKLVNSNDTLSGSVTASSYVTLPGKLPATSISANEWNEHPIMKTVRIPLSKFTSATLSSLRGVRFIFNKSSAGSIYLSTIRAAGK